MSPPPPAPAVRHYQPSASPEINRSEINDSERVERPRPRHAPERVLPAAVATPAPPVEPLSKPTVTLADGPSRERAQRMLDDAEKRLAKVKRTSLGADSATTYDQATNFLQAGRKAETEQDYVAASGFAQKAAVLATKLTPTSR